MKAVGCVFKQQGTEPVGEGRTTGEKGGGGAVHTARPAARFLAKSRKSPLGLTGSRGACGGQAPRGWVSFLSGRFPDSRL